MGLARRLLRIATCGRDAPNFIRGAGLLNKSNLGPVVFVASFAAALAFFWWLLIYSHGVQSLH